MRRQCVSYRLRMAGALANVSALVVDCTDPETLAAFWRSVLGGDLVPYPELGVVALRAPGVTFDVCVSEHFTVLRDPEGNEFCVLVDAPTTAPWAPPTS